ncbi:MAG: glutamine-hydrolyzing carbamoyl-phosphate synthase small subunit [Clostridia bacterium]|nr:glutamine-hydrolyzing carbamoyl-phosphate synthase small subunit [Clostridia bacterium]
MKAVLILEDKTRFAGESYGGDGIAIGEVVFNTGMTGYQEILTDPSYCGQIVAMTYPLIGNYGINKDDFESHKSFVRGFITRERCEKPSNFRSAGTLGEYLAKQGIPGLYGIDTRKLTKILREKGTMKGVIVPEGFSDEAAARMAAGFTLCNPVDEVTLSRPVEHVPETGACGLHAAVLDYGVKRNIVRSLLKRGIKVTVFPADTSADELLGGKFDGVMLSNGPGDPKDCRVEIENIRKMAGRIPIFAICLGHQLAALAMGGDTGKLRYGHRGCNHPVKDVARDRTYITSQNHGYTVLADSLGAGTACITHVNMNDMTVEGIRYMGIPMFSVQFHPEASPGPGDTAYLFDEFTEMMNDYKLKEKQDA